ncbi:MAG: shikimate dehydrogenase [Aigarchaeota archaeon]|nr:shikimate dehydrogenase [Candidatus Pelearchaeum maunauluense]
MKNRGKIYGVIGDPIEHSVSPAMFNAVFREAGLWDSIYTAIRVASNELQQLVRAIRLLPFGGINVTIPHKVSIMRYLDLLDESAEEVGAVNTVHVAGEELVGYNTDMLAVMRVLKQFKRAGDGAVVLGCGGAARAAAIALRELSINKQTFVGRSRKRMREMKRFTASRGIDAEIISFQDSKLNSVLEKSSVIINATPVGMYPNVKSTPIYSSLIPRGAVVFDMVYNPEETMLLRAAKRRGARIIGGLEMLVTQAEEAYRIWFGSRAPRDIMMRAARNELRRFKK